MAALSAALAAALLEKLIPSPSATRRLRRMRRSCTELIRRDAQTFARVIQATRARDRRAFLRLLKTAIDVPCRVFEQARALHAQCHDAQREVKPQFRSDLRCAMALASAAADSARTLIETNLAWLNDPAFAARIHRRMTNAGRPRNRRRR